VNACFGQNKKKSSPSSKLWGAQLQSEEGFGVFSLDFNRFKQSVFEGAPSI
jgi:hypothetical protein